MAQLGFSIRHLKKSFSQVLQTEKESQNVFSVDVSFEITPGKIHGLLGPNGAGKSTLMKMLTGEIAPDSGEIFCIEKGQDTQKNYFDEEVEVGSLPDVPPFYPHMKVREYLEFVAAINGIEKAQAKKNIDEIIADCELVDLQKKLIAHLSSGQKQKLGVAMALVNPGQFLILDEPTNALDPESVIHFRNVIKKWAKNRTVLISSHQLFEVEQICDEVTILNKGKVVASGEISTLRSKYKLNNLPQSVRIEMDLSEYRKSFNDSDFNIMNSMIDEIMKIYPIISHHVKIRPDSICELELLFQGGNETKRHLSKHFINAGIDLISIADCELDLEQIFKQAISSERGVTYDRI